MDEKVQGSFSMPRDEGEEARGRSEGKKRGKEAGKVAGEQNKSLKKQGFRGVQFNSIQSTNQISSPDDIRLMAVF